MVINPHYEVDNATFQYNLVCVILTYSFVVMINFTVMEILHSSQRNAKRIQGNCMKSVVGLYDG